MIFLVGTPIFAPNLSIEWHNLYKGFKSKRLKANKQHFYSKFTYTLYNI